MGRRRSHDLFFGFSGWLSLAAVGVVVVQIEPVMTIPITWGICLPLKRNSSAPKTGAVLTQFLHSRLAPASALLWANVEGDEHDRLRAMKRVPDSSLEKDEWQAVSPSAVTVQGLQKSSLGPCSGQTSATENRDPDVNGSLLELLRQAVSQLAKWRYGRTNSGPQMRANTGNERIREDAQPIRWMASRVRSSNGGASTKVRRSLRQAAISSAGRFAAA